MRSQTILHQNLSKQQN